MVEYKIIPKYVEPLYPVKDTTVAVENIPEPPGYKRILANKVYIVDDHGRTTLAH